MASTFTPYAGLSDTIQAVAAAGKTKTQLSLGQLFTLGFMAAAYLSFATTLSIVAGAGIETMGLQKLVMGVVFPIGLISLVIGGGEMWTGSSMNAPVAGMMGRARWQDVLYTLIGSYAGNFAGGLFCAWLLIKGGNVLIGPGYASPAWGEMLQKLTLMKVSLSFGQAFWRAFACVWLVDLAVFLSFRAQDTAGKFLLVWFPAATFFTMGLEHSVVNMFLIPAGIMAGAPVSWGQFFFYNQIPVTLGNAAAGAICLGLGYWYAAGMPVRKEVGAPGAGDYFSPDSEYVHADYGYLARTVLAIGKVLVGLALLMPGLASLLTFWLCEGAPAPQAPGAKPRGLFALYGEPVIGLALFVLLMVLWARKAQRGPQQTVRTHVVTGAALESIGSSVDGVLR
jgi:formate/nitrite transporter